MSLLSSCFLAFSVQIGIQSMPHLLSGELYPGDFRAKGKSLSRAITCLFIMLSLKLYLPLKDYLSDCGVFFFYSCIIILSVPPLYFENICIIGNFRRLSNWFYMPETKGVSLRDIEHFFNTSKSDLCQ